MKSQQRFQRFGRVTLAFTGVLALAACGPSGDDSMMAAEYKTADQSEMAYEESAADSLAAIDVNESSNRAGSFDNIVDTSIQTRDLIVEMGISIESDDISASVGAIRSLTTTAGGVITSSNIGVRTQQEDGGWATLIVRVPPDRLDSFLVHLDDPERVGMLTSSSTWTQDVTEQIVELDVRIENQRRSVDRIRELLAEAEDLSDIVTLEYELNRRQTDLEVHLARQASLADRVALSTVTIDLYSPGDAPSSESDRTIISGFVDGWSSFVAAMGSLGWFVAAASPYLGAVMVLCLVVTLVRRTRRTPGE